MNKDFDACNKLLFKRCERGINTFGSRIIYFPYKLYMQPSVS